MKLRIKLAVLVCLMLSSGYLAVQALKTISPVDASAEPPAEIYSAYTAHADDAEYYLRDFGGCIGVYAPEQGEPMEVTDIELACLREADRAMIEQGIPVTDKSELLTLLEDLGS